jgi:uncharacterized protein
MMRLCCLSHGFFSSANHAPTKIGHPPFTIQNRFLSFLGRFNVKALRIAMMFQPSIPQYCIPFKTGILLSVTFLRSARNSIMSPSAIAQSSLLEQTYFEFLRQDNFPCLAAQAALNKKSISTYTLEDLADLSTCPEALEVLYQYIDATDFTDKSFRSFALLFKQPVIRTEAEFEPLFWNYLQTLHDLDKQQYPYDKRVAENPSDKAFSFSVKSEAFFIIALHPANARPGRRFSNPAIVFNAHEQFEQLKESGTFEPLRNTIRERDKAMNGSINPMVQDFGTRSEAYQYTGRKYPDQWKCPFHP